jgi:hypothetical protein
MKVVGMGICMLLFIACTIGIAQLSEQETREIVVKSEIVDYMTQSTAAQSGDLLEDIHCVFDEGNNLTMNLVVSKKQDYSTRKRNTSVNLTMDVNGAIIVRRAIYSYVDVVLYWPTIGDLIITTNANKTYICHRNRVYPSVDRDELGRQIAYGRSDWGEGW